jgi:polyisoprenoid-binding protein YceI
MTKLRFVWGFIALALASSSQAQTSTISLVAETNHSTVQFNVPISKGITRITGKFNTYTIAMTLPDGDLTRATIKAVIQAASINTGDAGRDEDLKTEDFFDAAQYPEIVFTSERIEKANDGYVATGTLQLHGVTKTIQLPFTITERRDETTIGFRCRTFLRRSDYGVGTTFKHTTDDHFIADDIGIEIDFWTKKAKRS